MNLNFTAIIAAVVSIGAMASTAAGHPALAAVFSDPNTATELTAAVGGLAALVSAFAQGVQHPNTSVTVPAVAVVTSSPALSPSQVSAVVTAKETVATAATK